MSTQEIIDPPAKVAEYSPVAAGLAELRDKVTKTVFDVRTKDGEKIAREFRAECVRLRSAIETRRQEAKKPLLEKGRMLDAEAKRITAAILEIEKPIDEAIKAEERRREEERRAREQAEAEARRKIDQAIADIQFEAVHAAGKPASEIENIAAGLAARELTEAEFGARLAEAVTAKNATLERLRSMLLAARNQEAEAERLRQERAELARQQREMMAKTMGNQAAPAAQKMLSDAVTHGTGVLRVEHVPVRNITAPAVDDSNPFAEPDDGPAPTFDVLVGVIADHFDVAEETAAKWMIDAVASRAA